MDLKLKEILSYTYINYLETQIKASKSKNLKLKFTKQKNALICLLSNKK